MARLPLDILNAKTATFECIFGRGCDGICCRNGRPPVSTGERKVIAKNLKKFLPHLTPAARKLIEKDGFVSNRKKLGEPMLRVTGGWCVFFHEGCVLHKVGAAEGDKYKYKPAACSLFPLEQTAGGDWYVRQWGYRGEAWDLFCLNPEQSAKKAARSLREEIALAAGE